MRNKNVLRPTGSFTVAYQRLEEGHRRGNDFRLLHARERYLFAAGIRKSMGRGLWIDLCCGHGDTLKDMLVLCAPRTIIMGIDNNKAVIKKNKSRFHQCMWECADGSRSHLDFLPRGNRRLVTCFETIGHKDIQSDLRLLKNMRRIAGPTGTVLVSIARFEARSQFTPHWYFARRYGWLKFTNLWRRAGLGKANWYGQQYPGNREKVIVPNFISPTTKRFDGSDFMIGLTV